MDFSKIDLYVERGLISKHPHPTLPISLYYYTKECQYSKAWDDITLNSRCLILENDTKKLVAKGFPKFFNSFEMNEIPSLAFQIFEKMDGSFIMLFNYEGEWIFCSSKSFDSFHVNLAKEIFKERQQTFEAFHVSEVYIFELIHPETPIVVNYGDRKELVLLSVFYHHETDGYLEYSSEQVELIAWDINMSYVYPLPLNGHLTKIQQNIPTNTEGYVVRYVDGTRMKLKSKEYCELHTKRSYTSNKSILELLQNGHSRQEIYSILLNILPDEAFEWMDKTLNDYFHQYESIDETLNTLCMDMIFDNVDMNDKKMKAEWVKDKCNESHIRSLMFSIISGHDVTLKIWNYVNYETFEKPKWLVKVQNREFVSQTI